jgi:hypothetical protein
MTWPKMNPPHAHDHGGACRTTHELTSGPFIRINDGIIIQSFRISSRSESSTTTNRNEATASPSSAASWGSWLRYPLRGDVPSGVDNEARVRRCVPVFVLPMPNDYPMARSDKSIAATRARDAIAPPATRFRRGANHQQQSHLLDKSTRQSAAARRTKGRGCRR